MKKLTLDCGVVIETNHPEKIIQKDGYVILADPAAKIDNTKQHSPFKLKVGHKFYSFTLDNDLKEREIVPA